MSAFPNMSGLAHHPLNGSVNQPCDSDMGSMTTCPSFFDSIPPERVGLSGEYDHDGLSKRVLQAFQTHVDAEELQQLTVSQRGAVVVLMGKVRTRSLLERLSQIAADAYGAAEVETYGVRMAEPEMQSEYSYSVFRPSVVVSM